jgi:two-component system LytT family sensor kinase
MDAPDADLRPEGAYSRRWKSTPLFWRFQVLGWSIFLIASLPLKFVVLGSLEGALVVSLYREGMGFLTTWGMREIYRRWYRPSLTWPRISLLIFVVSGLGSTVQVAFVLGFHDFIDFEEEKIFREEAVFAVIYFRVAICLAWSALYFGIKLWRENGDRAIRMALLESQSKSAELQMLRSQINPHFLFNALNSIQAEVGNPNGSAQQAVQGLADFLRYSLAHRKDDFVTIGDEVDALASYLAVEKVRFREDLEFEMQVDEAIRTATVPGIFLQPLAENAIKYGRKSSIRPLKLRIEVAPIPPNSLRLKVANTGEWVEPSERRKVGGLGIENLRTRLDLLYPGKYRFEIHADDGWVTIEIDIPLTHDADGSTSGHHR